nr:unnamed protein product [Spirometra erinaceieuropaei]
MGGDGGSIPRRVELVRNKKEQEKAERSALNAARWKHCALSEQPLRQPIVACKLGRLYNKEAIIEKLLDNHCLEDEQKLEVFDQHCLRTMLRVKLTDIASNETVRALCDNVERITQAIQERRLRWFGYVLRRPPQELSVTALDPAPLPQWRRRRGGSRYLRLVTILRLYVRHNNCNTDVGTTKKQKCSPVRKRSLGLVIQSGCGTISISSISDTALVEAEVFLGPWRLIAA